MLHIIEASEKCCGACLRIVCSLSKDCHFSSSQKRTAGLGNLTQNSGISCPRGYGFCRLGQMLYFGLGRLQVQW